MLKSRLLSERQVLTVARKKIVFIIVEGPSDDEALGVLMERLFDADNVFVHITHGDITSEPGINPAFIINKVSDIVKAYAKSNHLTQSHFKEIIHIVDTDGAYISNDHILEDSAAEKPAYTLTCIKTSNVVGISNRNETKSLCLDRLSSAQTVWSIPYQAYYMSCNLDHVLYNKQNSTDTEKESDAFAFAQRYKDDLSGFVKYISESPFSVMSSYVDSWRFIKEDVHSLERYTNLGLCILPEYELNNSSGAQGNEDHQ